jgi:hypothetical protein
MHDHFGNFTDPLTLDGVNTVETQIADNDYAVGLIAETVAKSRYKDNTLIFVIEDDSQDGPDHVDSHRSTAFVIGPYVNQGAVVSKRYNTVRMLRTIEDILGIPHLNLNDEWANPMSAVFNEKKKAWSYSAIVPPVLCSTQLPVTVQPRLPLEPSLNHCTPPPTGAKRLKAWISPQRTNWIRRVSTTSSGAHSRENILPIPPNEAVRTYLGNTNGFSVPSEANSQLSIRRRRIQLAKHACAEHVCLEEVHCKL